MGGTTQIGRSFIRKGDVRNLKHNLEHMVATSELDISRAKLEKSTDDIHEPASVMESIDMVLDIYALMYELKQRHQGELAQTEYVLFEDMQGGRLTLYYDPETRADVLMSDLGKESTCRDFNALQPLGKDNARWFIEAQVRMYNEADVVGQLVRARGMMYDNIKRMLDRKVASIRGYQGPVPTPEDMRLGGM